MKYLNALIYVCFVGFCSPCMAQFNTIGTISPNRITRETIKREIEYENVGDSIAIMVDENTTKISYQYVEAKSFQVALPLKEIHITSGFGMRLHPVYGEEMMHNGVDLRARFEEVYSMLPGEVIKVGDDSRSGNYVTIRTADYTISYCHLSRIYVRERLLVRAGDPIALSGNSGVATGPHLHVTIKKEGKIIDPAILLGAIQNSTLLFRKNKDTYIQ